jgi:hypothetical protein
MAQRMTVELVIETPNDASVKDVEGAINAALYPEEPIHPAAMTLPVGIECGWHVGRARVTDVKRIGRR